MLTSRFPAHRLVMPPLLVLGAAILFGLRLAAQVPSPALRIVVIEGEDAVNIVQQKMAVLPVVEVRDRNNQPVAGAVVRFAVQGGRATFGSARTLSVTTNAAGRAVAAGLTPPGGGALQIGATAAFQGQTAAAVTIAQTNVMTAVEAAAMSSAGGAGGGAGGGASAGAGGAGLSVTTIGVVGGTAAAGTVVATQLLGGFKYNGTGACTRNEAQTGTIGMDLTDNNGTVTGTAEIQGDINATPGTCPPNLPGNSGPDSFGVENIQVTGTSAKVTFNGNQSNTFSGGGGSGVNAYTASFTGVFNGTEVTGALTITRTITLAQSPQMGTGTVVYNVTLR